MEVALVSRQPISEIRALPAADLAVLLDVIKKHNDV
jgi:hypothetical protein